MGEGNQAAEPRGAAVVALAADMIFAARIRGAAEAAGTGVVLTRTAEELLRHVEPGSTRLVLVDADARQTDTPELIGRLKRVAAVKVVAFGAHVNVAALEAARRAGADRVLARSGFVRALPDLLREAGA